MISIVPEQAVALRDFVIAALNLDDEGETLDPAPFAAANVVWTPRDHPRPGNLYAVISEVSLVPRGPVETIYASADHGEPEETLTRTMRAISEWTVSLQVVAKIDESDPQLGASAGRYLHRVMLRLDDVEATAVMRDLGIAHCRTGKVMPLPRVARGSQWETRAAVDLVFAVGEYVRAPVDSWIESVAGTGTLSPLPPYAFTYTIDDDLTPLL